MYQGGSSSGATDITWTHPHIAGSRQLESCLDKGNQNLQTPNANISSLGVLVICDLLVDYPIVCAENRDFRFEPAKRLQVCTRKNQGQHLFSKKAYVGVVQIATC